MAHITNGAGNYNPSETAGGALNDDGSVAALWARYEHLKYSDVMKNVLIEDVISRYEYLTRKHNEYVEEHKQELEYAKTTRQREQQLEASVAQLQRILNRDPFILVLIDGDGMIFNSAFLRQAEAGGKHAAAVLHSAVVQWAVANVMDCPPDVKVVVRIYANIRGLAQVCQQAGLVQSLAYVEEFARGFTRGKLLFDFIDVGPGKDRADGKIGEAFKLHLYDYQCRQILLGCSHDNGYARLLKQYVEDEAMTRVTLLEGTPFEKELSVLPFAGTKFSDIFRETKIYLPGQHEVVNGRARVDSHGLNAATAIFTPGSNTPTTIGSPLGSTWNLDGQPLAIRHPHLRLDSMNSTVGSPDNGPTTYASMATKNAHQPMVDLPRVPATKEAIKRNRQGQRIDDELEYDRDEVLRMKKLKCCNQHYIGGGCCHYNAGKTDKCPHNHHMKLTPMELKWLRVVAKETPCKKGHECDEPKCIYAHRCPFPLATEGSMRGIGCLNGDACRFPNSMHNMDNLPVKTFRATGAF